MSSHLPPLHKALPPPVINYGTRIGADIFSQVNGPVPSPRRLPQYSPSPINCYSYPDWVEITQTLTPIPCQLLLRPNTPQYLKVVLNDSTAHSLANFPYKASAPSPQSYKLPTKTDYDFREKKDVQDIINLLRSKVENNDSIMNLMIAKRIGYLLRRLNCAMSSFDNHVINPEEFKTKIKCLLKRALKNNNASSRSISDLGELLTRPSFKGKTLLLFTIEKELCAIIKLILALVNEENVMPTSYRNAFFNQKTDDGVTPVCLAHTIGNKKNLNALLDAGFSNAVSGDGSGLVGGSLSGSNSGGGSASGGGANSESGSGVVSSDEEVSSHPRLSIMPSLPPDSAHTHSKSTLTSDLKQRKTPSDVESNSYEGTGSNYIYSDETKKTL